MKPVSFKAIALLLALQVGLVGAFGAGLHSLLGCSHGVRLADGTYASQPCGCGCGCGEDSPFQRRREAQRSTESKAAAKGVAVLASHDSPQGCPGGCSICDLLKQYHSAAATEPAEAQVSRGFSQQLIEVERVDANVSTRLAESRGPPAFTRV